MFAVTIDHIVCSFCGAAVAYNAALNYIFYGSVFGPPTVSVYLHLDELMQYAIGW